MAQQLVAKPSDLTILAKNNGGVFPAQQVYEIIDGRKEVEAHGNREMPVWGREFRSTVPHIKELGLSDFGPQIAHARIASVIDYLYRIQEPNTSKVDGGEAVFRVRSKPEVIADRIWNRLN